MGFPAAFAAAALSAALTGLSFPPLGVAGLAWVCLVPLLLALRSGGPGRALLLTWFFSVFAAWAVMDTMPAGLSTYYLRPLWMGWGFCIFIWTATVALYYMAFAPAYRRLAGHYVALLPLLTAAAWTAAELARGRLFTETSFWIGNPWGLLGYTFAEPGPLAQIAAVTGVYGISFALVAVNAALAELAHAVLERGRIRPATWLGCGLAVLPALGFWLYGTLELQRAPRPGVTPDAVPIAVAQGDAPLGSRWRSEYYGRNLDIYLGLTRRIFAEGDPAVVFWPEAALTFFLEDEATLLDRIRRSVASSGAELIIGGPASEGPGGAIFNSVFQMAPDGRLVDRYDKRYLLPVTEYMPLRGLMRLFRRRFEGARVFSRGERTAPLETRAGRAGILICNEGWYPEIARRRVEEGAEFLVNPTNDTTWFRDEKVAARMLAIASLRAVEQRRYLVRAATSGPSAVVDPWGRRIVMTQALTRQILLGSVRPLRERTFYSRVGDLFAFGCAGAVAIALLAPLRRRRPGAPPDRGRGDSRAPPSPKRDRVD
jgi:apolipoprotein N-acyltransferase